MREEYMSSQEIIHEIAELKVRLILQQEFEREVEQILNEPANADSEEEHSMRELEKKVFPIIASHKIPSPRERGRILPKSLRVLIAAMILILVSICSAWATVQMIQRGLLKLDIQNYPERTSYGLLPSDERIEVPEEWEGLFYPTYIPEGFILDYSTFCDAEYRKSILESMSFSEYTYGARVSLDTENAKVTSTLVNGAEATLIEKNGWVAVVWLANNRLFVVEMDGSVEELLRIAESVTLIPQ